ncbi:MAG: 30S ribosome-binding factor RbfA [Planctomycetota bacterium]|nr:30S ribosome-binding factor RbfA [Planctomycetota bacterium]
MSSRRLLKAGEAIREVVSMAILTELRDPRVQNVTVLGVEVMPDMREAKVFISVLGTPIQQKTVLRGLQNSAGFLQAKIADRIETRYTPKLTFVADEGVKKSLAVSQILEQIAAEKKAKSADNSSTTFVATETPSSLVSPSDSSAVRMDSDFVTGADTADAENSSTASLTGEHSPADRDAFSEERFND